MTLTQMKRLPDDKFFDFPDQHGACLVMQSYSHSGGSVDFYVVNSPEELRELITNMRPRSRVEIVPAHDAFLMALGYTGPQVARDMVYTADKDGNLNPGCY